VKVGSAFASLADVATVLGTRNDHVSWLFFSDRLTQLTRQAVNYIVRLAGEKAARPSMAMLRHSCGYYLASKGTDLRNDAGLPRASRSQAHGALHPRRWASFRGALEV